MNWSLLIVWVIPGFQIDAEKFPSPSYTHPLENYNKAGLTQVFSDFAN